MPNISIVRNKNGALMGVAVESKTPRPAVPVATPVEAVTPAPRVRPAAEAPTPAPAAEPQADEAPAVQETAVRIPCPECSFTAASATGLLSHRRAKHGA
jgi:hypothetical protein